MQPGPGSQGDAPLAHTGRSVSGRHPRPEVPARPATDAIQALRMVGPYVIERELGRGSNGVVYLAHDPDRPGPVALKLLRVTKLEGEGRARFEREAEVGRSLLGDPGVIGVIETGEHQGRPWFAMEYCAGETLQDRLQQGPLEPRAAAGLALELLRTLSRAHARGIIHRDLKPGNVILEPGPGIGRPRIGDLGLARDLASAALTATGEHLGTPLYMAPEQFEDSKRVDDRADVWALGVILYECLTGRRPYQESTVTAQVQALKQGGAPPPGRLREGVDPRLDAICQAALTPVPSRRPGAEALGNELARFLAPPYTGATEASDSGQIPIAHPGARSPLSLVLAGAAGGLLLAGLIGGAVLLARPRDPDGTRLPAAPAAAPPWQLAHIRERLADGQPHSPELERAAREALERLGGSEAARTLRLELGRWLAWRGRHEDARAVLGDAASEQGPAGDEAALVLAWSGLLEGARGPAVWHDLARALERRERETARADAARAVMTFSSGRDRERAWELAQRASAADAKDPEVALAVALVQVFRREPGSREVDPRVAERAPVDPRASLVLGCAAVLRGEAGPAHEHLHRAMALFEGRGSLLGTLYLLGMLCRERGCGERLEPLLQRTLQGEGSTLAFLTRIAERRARGRPDPLGDDLAAALESLDDLVLHGGTFMLDPEMRGWIARQMGTHEGGGLAAWTHAPQCAVETDPGLLARVGAADPLARPQLLRTLIAAAAGAPPHELQSGLDQAREAAPDDPTVALEAVRVGVARDLPGVEAALARARELDPSREDELDLLQGSWLARCGRPGAARARLGGLVRRAPEGVAGLVAAAELQLLDGEWRQALELADRALGLDAAFRPALVARLCALVPLDPRQADTQLAEALDRQFGYAEARLVAAGAELAARAQVFAIAVTQRPHETEETTLNRRATLLKQLSEGSWISELEARLYLVIAPYLPTHGPMLQRAEAAIEAGLRRAPDRSDLELARGMAGISVDLLNEVPPGDAEACLERWGRALRGEPGLRLPAVYATRFASLYPRHRRVAEWRRGPVGPFAAFLADRLRAAR